MPAEMTERVGTFDGGRTCSKLIPANLNSTLCASFSTSSSAIVCAPALGKFSFAIPSGASATLINPEAENGLNSEMTFLVGEVDSIDPAEEAEEEEVGVEPCRGGRDG